MKIDPSKLSIQNFPQNESLKEEPLEKESPEELPPEEEQVHKKYWIETKLLSTTYFHLKLHLTLPEVMMILNHNPSKNVDVEIIGQYGMKQFKQN